MLLRGVFTIFILFIFGSVANAQDFSYIYIQGDKQTPFYVKLEEQMMPRYGKNYHIIPQLAPGTVNIEVLFQQNKYPPGKFTVVVPEHDVRGFLLVQKENIFVLYDIHQGFYIYPGNKAEDDRYKPGKVPAYTMNDAEKNIASQIDPVKQSVGGNSSEPRFIESVELSRNSNNKNTLPVVKESSKNATSKASVIPNSDCPEAISEDEFREILVAAYNEADNARVKFLLSQMKECYTTNQAKILVKTLTTDPQRYTFLKKIYPRITDQSAFSSLEEVLISDEWKDYFRLIISN